MSLSTLVLKFSKNLPFPKSLCGSALAFEKNRLNDVTYIYATEPQVGCVGKTLLKNRFFLFREPPGCTESTFSGDEDRRESENSLKHQKIKIIALPNGSVTNNLYLLNEN